MKLLYVILKEIKESLRDIRSLLILFIMPLLLTSILAVTFKDKLSNNIDLSNITVYYTLNCNEKETPVILEYISLLNNVGIKTIPSTNTTNEEIHLNVNSLSDITLSYNNESNSHGKLIYSLLDTFLKKYTLLGPIALENTLTPNMLNQIQTFDYVTESSLKGQKTPSSLDYYGVVMLTLSFMFSSVIGAYKIVEERNSGTLTKLSALPVSKTSIILGKLIGTTIMLFIEGLLILLISNKILKVYMGDNLLPIFIVFFSLIIFAISLGILVGYTLKDTQSALLLLVIAIIILGFLGGAFIPLSNLNSDLIYKLSLLSPISYVNNSIFNYIYTKNLSMCVNTALLNLVISTILILITSTIMEVKK